MQDLNLMMYLATSFAFTCVILPGYLEDRNIRTDNVLAIPVFMILGFHTWASYLICCIAGHALLTHFITGLFKWKRKYTEIANKKSVT